MMKLLSWSIFLAHIDGGVSWSRVEIRRFDSSNFRRPSTRVDTASGGTTPQVPPKIERILGDRRLLPVQEAAFELIRGGSDAVIHAPTGDNINTVSWPLLETATWEEPLSRMEL